MQPIDKNRNFYLEPLNVYLNNKLRFLKVKKVRDEFKIISYSENECNNLERTIYKQRFIFINLIKCLRLHNSQNTNKSKALTQGHYPDCKFINEAELDFETGVIILKANDHLCPCAKIQILFHEIYRNCRNKSVGSSIVEFSRIADGLEQHKLYYLSCESTLKRSRRDSKENGSSSSESQSSPLPNKSQNILAKRTRSDSSGIRAGAFVYCKDKIDKHIFGKSLNSEITAPEAPKNQTIFKDIRMFDDQVEKLCIIYWKKKYILNMSEANIYKNQEFAILKLNSTEDSFNSLRFFFENPCMSTLLKHKIERFLITLSENINNQDSKIVFKTCSDASEDINRMLPFLTLICPDDELRVEHQEEISLNQKKRVIPLELLCREAVLIQKDDRQNVEETNTKRPETAKEKKIYFEKVIKFILDFLNTLTPAQKFKLPGIKFDDNSDNDAFTSYCREFILELQKQKLSDKENGLRIDILINLLLSLAQYNYTLPGQAIINFFPALTLKNNSPCINLHFNSDIVNLSIHVSLIPKEYKFNSENLPYEIVIKHTLCANIFELPNWTSTIKVQMRNPTKNPPEIITLLEKIKFNTPL